MMSVIRFDGNRGGLAYPFLPDTLQWEIVSRPLDNDEAATVSDTAENPIPSTNSEPALRWVKDDKVLDLHISGMNTADFLAHTGLKLSMDKGGYVLSKRLSRVMRPYRYWGFFDQDEVKIDYNEFLDGRLWDGCGLVSRAFVQCQADSLELDGRHRRELLYTNRFEVTTLHADGQDKGHVLVVDDLTCDFMFPAGSAKTELFLVDPSAGSTSLSRSGQASHTFIGLNPIHSEDQMCLDIQSLINLYPFFQTEKLLAWAGMESELFLSGIRDGRLESILNRLYTSTSSTPLSRSVQASPESVSDLDSLSSWHVGEYIASGGRLMWFAGIVKAVAKQHLNRLGSRASKLRTPVPGGRYYIFPAAVGERQVPEGCVELDPTCATAWVNDDDWLTYIVDVLGGCDGDDALWIFPYTDTSGLMEGKRPSRKVLIWRSPNQLGEYVVLTPTENSHVIEWDVPGGKVSYPKMKSRLLPDRIDKVQYQYASLTNASDSNLICDESYSVEGMLSTINQASTNQGVLGAHCNALMLCKAIYGRLPEHLPATLEDIIDGSIKTGLDLTPVKEWNQMAVTRMVKHGQKHPNRAMPEALLDRLPEWLRQQAVTADSHWLDTLTRALELHKAQYWADVEALATEACPPVELFEHGRDWLAAGKELRRIYSHVYRRLHRQDDGQEADEAVYTAARTASESFLNRWPEAKRHLVLMGAAAYLYAQGPQNGTAIRDGLLWQLGARREGSGRHRVSGRYHGIANLMLDALRQIGLLGEPTWTLQGAVLHYRDQPQARCSGVPVRLNGVWLNLLNATKGNQYTRMSDVPAEERQKAKARIADFVQERFRGMMLFTEVTDQDRVITRTPHGNLFGYVQRDHELAAIRYDRWRIAWATAVDGNVWAVLDPVTA
jgi:hypothetical protein